MKKTTSPSLVEIVLETNDVLRKKRRMHGEDETRHDFFFDHLMMRFDALQENRSDVCKARDACLADARLAACVAKAQFEGMKDLAKAAKARKGTAIFLLAAYNYAFAFWVRDTSQDLGKTMAALDSALNTVDKIETTLIL